MPVVLELTHMWGSGARFHPYQTPFNAPNRPNKCQNRPLSGPNRAMPFVMCDAIRSAHPQITGDAKKKTLFFVASDVKTSYVTLTLHKNINHGAQKAPAKTLLGELPKHSVKNNLEFLTLF